MNEAIIKTLQACISGTTIFGVFPSAIHYAHHPDANSVDRLNITAYATGGLQVLLIWTHLFAKLKNNWTTSEHNRVIDPHFNNYHLGFLVASATCSFFIPEDKRNHLQDDNMTIYLWCISAAVCFTAYIVTYYSKSQQHGTDPYEAGGAVVAEGTAGTAGAAGAAGEAEEAKAIEDQERGPEMADVDTTHTTPLCHH